VSGQRKFAFGGLYIGGIASALLLSFAIESLVATIREPIAAAVIEALNWLVRVGRLNISPIQPVNFSWILIAYTGITGIALLLLGLKLAAWATQGARQSERSL
jgi:hypothetical protein